MKYPEIIINTGYRCNNFCKFCPYPKRKLRQEEDKSFQAIEAELEKAREKTESIIFAGGEPTIRKDFFGIIKKAKSLKFKTIGIKSNGRMFNYKNFCQKTVELGANLFIVSLHGNIRELHDWLTSSPGSFEQTIQGIRNLKLLKKTVISETVITKSNYPHLPEIAKLLIKLGVDRLRFKFPKPTGIARENAPSIIPKNYLVQPYLQKALKLCKDRGEEV